LSLSKALRRYISLPIASDQSAQLVPGLGGDTGDMIVSTPTLGESLTRANPLSTPYPLPLCLNTRHQTALTPSSSITLENGRPDGLTTLYPWRFTPTPYPTSGPVPSTCQRRPSRLSRHRLGLSHARMPPKWRPSQAFLVTPSHPLTPSSSLTATVRGTTTQTLYPASHLYVTS
jgi:hypothetical protein